jgi:SAM-dependent methyltransferase
MNTASEFDEFADSYEADLNQALAVSGEDKDFFSRARVNFLADCLCALRQKPRLAMDYGCGIGGTSLLLRELLGTEVVIGLDVSDRSLERARNEFGNSELRFYTFTQYEPAADVDLAYCNGVFHHIPVEERSASVRYIYRSLRPGGLFAFWENNPWNPGTRYVMSNCVFDRTARTLSPPEARGLLRDAGFQVVRTDFLFYFPRALKLLRFLESGLRRVPLGAQYQVLCRKGGS